jgi:hypothetical protein
MTTLEPISLSDSKLFIKCEQEILAAKDVFTKVAKALATIRDKRLYRAEYKTFAEYCNKRHGWAKSYGYNMAKAGEVLNSLPENSTIVESEAHTRELAKAPAEKREEILETACERAERDGKPLTAAHIKSAVDETERSDADEVTQAEIQTAGGTDSDPSRPVFVPKLDKQFNDLAHAARGATDTMFEWIDGAEWDTDAAKDAEKSLRLAAGTVAQLLKQAKRAETK